MRRNHQTFHHTFCDALHYSLCVALCCALFCMAALPVIPVYAAETKAETKTESKNESKTVTLTYDNAVKMATKNLSGVLALEDTIKALKDQYGQSSSVINKQIDSMKLNQTMIKTSTELTLMNALVAIDQYEMDIRLMESTIRLNEEQLRRVNLKKRYGVASENERLTAEQTLTQNQTNLETLRISLANERQALNKILQVSLTQDTVVTYERVLAELPEDLDDYIAAKIKNDPGLKQKQLTVDIKKLERDNNTDPAQKTTLTNEYDKAIRERDDAKKALEAAIRTNYNNLEQLLKQATSLQVDLEKAEANLNTAQAHYKAGMATRYDVDNAALAITNNEIAIEKNLNKCWTLYFAFTNPFLLV